MINIIAWVLNMLYYEDSVTLISMKYSKIYFKIILSLHFKTFT